LSQIFEPEKQDILLTRGYFYLMDALPNHRYSPFVLSGAEFKTIAYGLIDQLASFLDEIDRRPVTTQLASGELAGLIGRGSFAEDGRPAAEILQAATDVLLEHSLLNGHPKFAGYITSSPAPIGALADLLAAIVNPNVGAGILSPVATVIEKQVVKWLGEFLGLPTCFDGLLVSGGNMANFTGFCAGMQAKLPGIKKLGFLVGTTRPMIYCARTTHTWIEKAASLFGLGTESIGWIAVDDRNRMDIPVLVKTIEADRA
jgi:aromatic-L-amino-acid decarboxylase